MRYAPSYRPIAIADRDADRTRKFSFAPVARVPHPQARPPDYLPASYPCVRTARFASFVALVGREPIRSSYEWKAGLGAAAINVFRNLMSKNNGRCDDKLLNA